MYLLNRFCVIHMHGKFFSAFYTWGGVFITKYIILSTKKKGTVAHAGCVELYVKEGARLRYSTIENWSRNMMNLNTKRALVEKDGIIEWVSGSFGSHAAHHR